MAHHALARFMLQKLLRERKVCSTGIEQYRREQQHKGGTDAPPYRNVRGLLIGAKIGQGGVVNHGTGTAPGSSSDEI